jgi:hypothetical protein
MFLQFLVELLIHDCMVITEGKETSKWNILGEVVVMEQAPNL